MTRGVRDQAWRSMASNTSLQGQRRCRGLGLIRAWGRLARARFWRQLPPSHFVVLSQGQILSGLPHRMASGSAYPGSSTIGRGLFCPLAVLCCCSVIMKTKTLYKHTYYCWGRGLRPLTSQHPPSTAPTFTCWVGGGGVQKTLNTAGSREYGTISFN